MTEQRPLELVDAAGEPAAEWDRLAVHSRHGAALQSHAWSEFKGGAGWTPLRFRLADGGDTRAVVALQERSVAGPLLRRLPGGAWRSQRAMRLAGRLLYAPHGPILLDDAEPISRRALSALATLAAERGASLLIVDPEWPLGAAPAAALAASGFRPGRPVQVSRTAMLVPLEQDEAAQRRLLNENVRRNIGRAERAGVTVSRLDATAAPAELAAALDVAYTMLAETGRRRGFRPRPREYHAASTRALIGDGVADLWLAQADDRVAAYTLAHRNGERLVLYEAAEATGGARERSSANFLLQWTILRWAAQAGFASYDLGGVDSHAAPGLPRDESHPLWSLFRFKSQWGARPVEFVGAHELYPRRLLGLALRMARRAPVLSARLGA